LAGAIPGVKAVAAGAVLGGLAAWGQTLSGALHLVGGADPQNLYTGGALVLTGIALSRPVAAVMKSAGSSSQQASAQLLSRTSTVIGATYDIGIASTGLFDPVRQSCPE
jgi:hypothetical protein